MLSLRSAAAAVQKSTEDGSEAAQAAAAVIAAAGEAEGDLQAVFVTWSKKYSALEADPNPIQPTPSMDRGSGLEPKHC